MQSGWKSRFTLHKPGDPLKLAPKSEQDGNQNLHYPSQSGGPEPQGSPLQSVPKTVHQQASVVVLVVVQSGWKSGFTLHNPGGGHGPQESPLQSVPKSEQLQASVVEVVIVA